MWDQSTPPAPSLPRTSRQLSRRTVSMPLVSILSHLSGLVHSRPAYRFLLISRYGLYTCDGQAGRCQAGRVVTGTWPCCVLPAGGRELRGRQAACDCQAPHLFKLQLDGLDECLADLLCRLQAQTHRLPGVLHPKRHHHAVGVAVHNIGVMCIAVGAAVLGSDTPPEGGGGSEE